MDFKQLKKGAKKVISAFKAEGKPLTFAALVPETPYLARSPYVFLVGGNWLKDHTYLENSDLFEQEAKELLPSDVANALSHISIFRGHSNFLPWSHEQILVNEIGYAPMSVLFGMLAEART